MKETISANIGGRAFTLDRDAFDRLSDYLADVRNRVNDPTGEIMADIESGIADIFSTTLSSQGMVVTLQMVEATITRMGNPDDFGPATFSCVVAEQTALLPEFAEVLQSISSSNLRSSDLLYCYLYSSEVCHCGSTSSFGYSSLRRIN